MSDVKTMGFQWELGQEEVSLWVSSYVDNGRLYVGMKNRQEDGSFDSFGDVTVNLPHEPCKVGEAFIDDSFADDMLEFIKKNQLGQVLQEAGHSGFSQYAKVAFDLDRLAEFDPDGIQQYKRHHKLTEKTRSGKRDRER